MTTIHTQNEVWQGMLDCARLSRYYNIQADRYHTRHEILQGALFLAATGSAAAILDVLPDMIALLANAAVAVCAVLHFFQDYGKKAAVLHTISSDCLELEKDWRLLWNEQSSLEDSEVLNRNDRLSERLNMVTGRSGLIGVRDNDTLNRRCQEEAFEVMESHYAAVRNSE